MLKEILKIDLNSTLEGWLLDTFMSGRHGHTNFGRYPAPLLTR